MDNWDGFQEALPDDESAAETQRQIEQMLAEAQHKKKVKDLLTSLETQIVAAQKDYNDSIWTLDAGCEDPNNRSANIAKDRMYANYTTESLYPTVRPCVEVWLPERHWLELEDRFPVVSQAVNTICQQLGTPWRAGHIQGDTSIEMRINDGSRRQRKLPAWWFEQTAPAASSSSRTQQQASSSHRSHRSSHASSSGGGGSCSGGSRRRRR